MKKNQQLIEEIKRLKMNGIKFKFKRNTLKKTTFIGKINLQQIITHHWHTLVEDGLYPMHYAPFNELKRTMIFLKQFR